MDALTWACIGSFFAFWTAEGVAMAFHKPTISRLIGDWEGESAVRHVLIAIAPFVLLLHLAFFP